MSKRIREIDGGAIIIMENGELCAFIKIFGFDLRITGESLKVDIGAADMKIFDMNRHDINDMFFIADCPKYFDIPKINSELLSLYVAINFQHQHIELAVDKSKISRNENYELYPIKNFTIVDIFGDGTLIEAVTL